MMLSNKIPVPPKNNFLGPKIKVQCQCSRENDDIYIYTGTEMLR